MNALSLFSGIGGIDLACEWAGIETVAFCEREPFCQKVLNKHWPDVPIYDDVCTLTKERLEADGIGTIDIIHGGYPCQPFSHAGKREGENDDRHLWPEVFRLLQEIQPNWFVGENVAGHITLGLDTVLSDLGDIGYTAQPFVIPACGVNAPHRRERVFIVAHSNSIGWNNRLDNWEERYFQINGKRNLSKDQSEWNGWIDRFRTVGSTSTDSSSSGLQERRQAGINKIVEKTGTGMESEFKRYRSGREQWEIEPDVGRVANGIPNRVDRLKALGNAVVPQQIYPILAAIKQIDDLINAA